MALVPLSFVAKNPHVSHSTQGVTHSVNQSEALDFVKWLLCFLSHPLRRYEIQDLAIQVGGGVQGINRNPSDIHVL